MDDWSAGTTTSVTFCASATSGEGTAPGADRREGIGGGVGVILLRFGALPLPVVSSSLSRLSSRGLSADGEDIGWNFFAAPGQSPCQAGHITSKNEGMNFNRQCRNTAANLGQMLCK
jgi:hypothetical protein